MELGDMENSLTKNRVKLTEHIHRGVMREKETHSQSVVFCVVIGSHITHPEV